MLFRSFLVPYGYATNQFMLGSVFLAFAYLYPDFQLYIFFILPVRIKWLALLTWLFYGWTMITGDWMSRAMATAAVANFLLFFGRDIKALAKYFISFVQDIVGTKAPSTLWLRIGGALVAVIGLIIIVASFNADEKIGRAHV